MVFNPNVIERYRVVKAADVKLEDRDLPLIQRGRALDEDCEQQVARVGGRG